MQGIDFSFLPFADFAAAYQKYHTWFCTHLAAVVAYLILWKSDIAVWSVPGKNLSPRACNHWTIFQTQNIDFLKQILRVQPWA